MASNLYVPQIIKVKINLEPGDIDANYEDKIKRKIKDKFGDTCYYNGFIRKSSIEITKIENGRRLGSHLRGIVTFGVEFRAEFCLPRKDTVIRARIKTINKIGIQAMSYPIELIIPRQLQQYEPDGLDLMANLKEGDYIYVRSLNYKIQEDKLIVVGIITQLELEKPRLQSLPNNGVLGNLYEIDLKYSASPPKPLKELGSNQALNLLKDRITPIESSGRQWTRIIRQLISPYELIDIYRPSKSIRYNQSLIRYDPQKAQIGYDPQGGLNPVFSRAYFKLWEILGELNILQRWHNQPMNIANLAEGPGGFIQCLIDARNRQHDGQWKQDHYQAITLKSQDNQPYNDWDSLKPYEHNNPKVYFAKADAQGYHIRRSYGTGSGNLLELKEGQLTNIRYFIDHDLGNRKCDLVTADGGIELSSDEAYSQQEIANAKLFFSEILTALSIQKPGGTFILKIYDIYYQLTLQMLLLLSIYYGDLSLIKPRTSRPANSEMYVVAREFNGIDESRLEALRLIFVRWLELEPDLNYERNTQFVSQLFTMGITDPKDSDFFQNLISQNEYCIVLQMEKINDGLELFANQGHRNKETILGIKSKQRDLGVKWCEEFHLPFVTNLPLNTNLG